MNKYQKSEINCMTSVMKEEQNTLNIAKEKVKTSNQTDEK